MPVSKIHAYVLAAGHMHAYKAVIHAFGGNETLGLLISRVWKSITISKSKLILIILRRTKNLK